MTRQEIEQKLADYAAGELTPAEAAALREAAASDPAAAERLAQLEKQDALLSRYYGAAARAALSPPRPALPPLRDVKGRPRLAWPVYAVAAVFVAILTAGALLLSWHGVATALADTEIGVASVVDGSVLYFSDDGLRLVKQGMPITSAMRVKVPSRSYLQVRLHSAEPKKGSNVLEMRENTVAIFKDYREQTQVHLEQGEVWVHLNYDTPKQFAVKTREHLIRHEGTIFNVVQGLTGTAIGVMDGRVSFDQSGSATSLSAFAVHTSFESAGAYSLATHIPWSRYSDKLFAMLPGDMRPAPVQTIPLLADQTTAKSATISPADSMNEAFGTHQPTSYLPVNTRLLVDLADVSDVISDWNASDYSDLFRDPALREWWDSDSMEEFRHHVENVIGLPRWARLITSVPDRLSVGIAHDGSVVMIGDCRNDYGTVELIFEQDIAPLLEAWAARTNQQSLEHFRAELKRGYLIIGIQDENMSGLNQSFAAIETDTPTGFTNGDFYHKIEDNAPNSRLTIAFDFKSTFQIIQSKGDAGFNKFLARTGFEKLDYILGSPDFVGAGINQAFRVGFTGERTGVLGWLDSPGPMGSLRFYSGDVHAFVAMRVKSPAIMMQDILRWEIEDSGRQTMDIEQKVLDYLNQIAECFGNEVAVGLQNPVLPIPNVQIAVEATDPQRFHSLFADYINMLNEQVAMSSISYTESTYRDTRIVSISHSEMPFHLTWAALDDYIIFGPGVPFLERTIDVFLDRQSLMDQQAFRAMLPETGRMNFSMLFYQDLSRAVPRMVDNFKQQMFTAREQSFVPATDVVSRFHKAGISYAISYHDHIDFFMNGSRGVDFNLGGTMPFVASLIVPRLIEGDTETQIATVEKRLDALRAALESYKVDNERYPDSLVELLSPVMYLSEVPGDPFSADRDPLEYYIDHDRGSYVIYSIGPDGKDDLGIRLYDPSLGVRSPGDILYTNDAEWEDRAKRAAAQDD